MNRAIVGTVVGTARGEFGKPDLEEVGAAFEAEVDEPEEGQSVELIIEDAEGRLWAWSPDLATQINFCPFTGRQARTPIDPSELLAIRI